MDQSNNDLRRVFNHLNFLSYQWLLMATLYGRYWISLGLFLPPPKDQGKGAAFGEAAPNTKKGRE